MVGVAKPIYINFAVPIANRQLAQDSIHISSVPPVPGRFYWVTDTQLRWRPQDFWPANTVVNIDAAGTKSTFRTGDYLATIDDKAHQMEVMRNGKVEKTFPVSMGRPDGKHETKNGTYYVLEKFPDLVMDSSTYGVPVDSAEGYKLKVQDASGSTTAALRAQRPVVGGRSGQAQRQPRLREPQPANAQWFYDNFGSGDPVVVKGTGGGSTTRPTAPPIGSGMFWPDRSEVAAPRGRLAGTARRLQFQIRTAAPVPGTARRRGRRRRRRSRRRCCG
jgi:lipoprotein-anchoring transpeptidase ErfK/SrfK